MHSPEGAVEELPARTSVDDASFRRVLAHRDVCSREPLYRRYDGVVRGTHRDAARRGRCRRARADPGSRLGVALAVAGNPRYGRIDAGYAAEHAVLEAVRNVVAVGARPIGLTDCLNFGNPRKPEHYGEFVAAVDGLARAATRARPAVRLRQRQPLQRDRRPATAVPGVADRRLRRRARRHRHVVTPGLKDAGFGACSGSASRELVVGGSVLGGYSLGIDGRRCRRSPTTPNARRSRILHARSARGIVLLVQRRIRDGGC